MLVACLSSLDTFTITIRNNISLDRLRVLHCSIAELTKVLLPQKFHAIIANPPYIPTKDMNTLQEEVTCYESHVALHGGTDGLHCIEAILRQAHWILIPGGLIMLEIDPSQPNLIRDLVESSPLKHKLLFKGVHKDLYGCDRFVELERTH
eukprot:m.44025 g.44025  ORF g.44025 m.44025 type:complete len:150 (+) comp17208_c0_seq1:584-1033(+)